MPTDSPLMPTAIANDGEALVITWSDEVISRLPWSMLRKCCPCASCRLERENPKPAPPPGALPMLSLQEAQPIRPRSVTPAGNYAYAIDFTDGHHSGIYTLEYLRELGTATPQQPRK